MRFPVTAFLAALLPSCSACETPCAQDTDCSAEDICSSGSCEDAAGRRFDLVARGSTLIYRNDLGTISIFGEDGRWILRGATAVAVLGETSEGGRPLSISGTGARTVSHTEETDALGAAERLVVSAESSDPLPRLTWTLSSYGDQGFYTARLAIEGTSPEPVSIAKAVTLRADGKFGAGLFVGQHPATHRILENGSYGVLDHVVQILPGDTQESSPIGGLVPGGFEGASVSNWNHALKDLETGASWIAGTLTVDASTPVMNLSFDPALASASPDGRIGFSYFSAEGAYLPEPKRLIAGARVESETTYLHPAERDPLVGLERYADAIKRSLSIRLWRERGNGNRVPNGWNSWSGSGGTGGYGTDIDEDIILANLEVMARELRDFGMDWFQVDDGYQYEYGDWVWREDRFPHGPRWLSDRIRERGLRPGLWIAAFTPHATSTTSRSHPDWIAGRSDLGNILGTEFDFLDLTHPEVLEWLRELFARIRHEWGFDWAKVDFSYWSVLGNDFHDPTKTREEAYRGAMRAVREGLGDDAFLLAVSALGLHYGLVDSDRITLDSAPIWDWQPGTASTARLNQQGLKPTVRTAARRYYLHDRVWVTHPDLIFFRSGLDPTWPRLSLSESQAFATYVAMSGGIVKLGDRLVDLEPEHVNTIRKLLPIHGKAARPLDLFEREFPERWHLPVTETLDGYDERYDLVTLFNWGFNFDLTTNPYSEMPDENESKTLSVDLAGLELAAAPGPYLAYEFWTGRFLGEVSDRLELSVPAHSARVVAIRSKSSVPQFLGWNRQITMGGACLEAAEWNSGRLTLVAKVAKPTELAPLTYDVAFHVPEGFELGRVSYSGAAVDALESTREGPVVRVSFVPLETGRLAITLEFE
ncbi:MAG: alpha-galactosidase [Deltaproteobacteria bacterium]|nr:alpha-galactosidase [Deltaproteobacteria bacterium]